MSACDASKRAVKPAAFETHPVRGAGGGRPLGEITSRRQIFGSPEIVSPVAGNVLSMNYTEPEYGAASFTCPHCEVTTGQNWAGPSSPAGAGSHGFAYSICQSISCQNYSLWVGGLSVDEKGVPTLDGGKVVWPPVRVGPEPNSDLNADIQKDYNEARTILSASPRGAAALLRLALQRLMKELGKPGENINDDIAALVGDGLRADVQQAADIVRVTGNDSVHPGQIDTDDALTVKKLFELINIIADDRITQPARVKAIYQDLPEDKRKAIENRDSK